MGRHPHWEQRFAALVAASAERPHDYGRWDCLLWPAAAVRAVTGTDFGRGHRGRYRSLAAAYRHLQGMGFASPEALLDSLFECKPVGFAQRGDLVLVAMPALTREAHGLELAAREIPAVVDGDVALVVGELVAGGCAAARGFLRAPRCLWRKAWAVGEHHSGKVSRSRRKRARARRLPARAEAGR